MHEGTAVCQVAPAGLGIRSDSSRESGCERMIRNSSAEHMNVFLGTIDRSPWIQIRVFGGGGASAQSKTRRSPTSSSWTCMQLDEATGVLVIARSRLIPCSSLPAAIDWLRQPKSRSNRKPCRSLLNAVMLDQLGLALLGLAVVACGCTSEDHLSTDGMVLGATSTSSSSGANSPAAESSDGVRSSSSFAGTT